MSYFCRTHQVQRWEKQDMIATKMWLKKETFVSEVKLKIFDQKEKYCIK